jgi:hypothetical protein
MNRKLKIALAGAGLIAATSIGAGLVLADSDGPCGHRHGMMRGAWGGDIKAMADGRLDRLHAGLKLRADQEAAWGDFRLAVDDQAAHLADKVKAWRDAAPTATAVERLDRAQQGLDEGRVALQKLSETTKRFYATLDKEQQARFDELTRRFAHGGHGWDGPGRGA